MHEDVYTSGNLLWKTGGLYSAKRERSMIDRLLSFRIYRSRPGMYQDVGQM